MKKILFVTPHMICAGVEKSLIALIKEIPEKDFEVTVLMVKARGPLMKEIPSNVKYDEIKIPDKIANELLAGGVKASILKNIKSFKFYKAIKLFWRKAILKDPFSDLNMNFEEIESLNEEYDIAICYHIHMPFIVRFVAEKVKAKNKVAWIHNDFYETKYDIKSLSKYLEDYNYFFAVSKQLMKEYIDIFPEFKKNTTIFYNIISAKTLLELANENITFNNEFHPCENDTIKLLTIGRLNYQKGYDLALDVCKMLKDDGLNFKWYVLGEGEQREYIEKRILELGLSNRFILLGLALNPYPYIKECDLYVQTSRHEGYCTTINEARILKKPIVTTNVSGVDEMLIHKENASISDFNTINVYRNIKELILNRDIRELYSENLQNLFVDTTNEIEKLLKIGDE